jgi:hypothetical protein
VARPGAGLGRGARDRQAAPRRERHAVTSRLDDLDVICSVLSCTPSDLLVCEPDKVAARRPAREKTADGGGPAKVKPRLGRNRTLPPA